MKSDYKKIDETGVKDVCIGARGKGKYDQYRCIVISTDVRELDFLHVQWACDGSITELPLGVLPYRGST